MKRVAWITDVHLNFLGSDAVRAFLDRVAASGPDAVLIGGDIGEARDLVDYLNLIEAHLQCPVYFVLGNHDFYFGSIRALRAAVAKLCSWSDHLCWLPQAEVIELTPDVGLVGHDGWADARLGDYERSYVMMNDYRLIEELARFDKQQRWGELEALGDEAAGHIRHVLPDALARYPHVVLLTHVPPWREACWHEGAISDDQWLPHFTCKAMGDAVLEVMQKHTDRQLTVLCGHTHSSGECRPLDNVLVLIGGAEYGRPEIQRVFEFE